MANQQKGSRWGSFLSQAVAGMEAHLDNMLEGEGDPRAGRIQPNANSAPGTQTTPASATPAPAATAAGPKNKPAPARSSSTTNRGSDRLQERLAKAMAAKGGSTPSESTSARASIDEASLATAASNDQASARHSEDTASVRSRDSVAPNAQPRAASPMRVGAKPEPAVSEGQAGKQAEEEPDAATKDQPRESIDAQEAANDESIDGALGQSETTSAPTALAALQAEQEEALHRYVEQVDALQAKLQYLSKESSEAARKAAAGAESGTAEKKLAEKDEKIALLMEEGRSMAANEQKLRAIIKKLRTQVAESEKSVAGLKANQEKTQAELENVRNRTGRLEEVEKDHSDTQRLLSRVRAELEGVRSDLSIKDNKIKSLRDDLQKAQDEADSASAKAAQDALVVERKRTKELEDNIASLQLEKNLVADRAKKQASELAEKADREAERARVSELELKGELQAMEGKLEAMRALAEEASSGAVGDSQAKLLRQVETLQTQHAIASENWHGIEANLVARVTNLEKERDEAQKRESDMRKKARETTMRCKRQEEQIEDLTSKVPDYQVEMDELKRRAEASQKAAEAAEAALAQAKADFEKQQASWRTAAAAERSELPDRKLWLDDATRPSSRNQSRPASPLLSVPTRTFSSDFLSSEPPGSRARKISTPNSNTGGGFLESISPSRRLSGQPQSRPPALSPSMAASSVSMASFEPPLQEVQTPTVGERDDMFDGMETTSSPRQMMQDMVSVSTVGAGPSVQLVERMSAAIRRLEAEKVASREELARISGQRDEARAEIVALMKDTESGKAATKRVEELEAEVADINARYQTTLELLGEKSELVEELRADVQDVKAMYRDLVESTVKG